MNDDIKVSIITPCYNAGPYLRPAIESALNQTKPPHEVIVIDDGSTDDSASVAESFGGRVHVIRQENRGESVARNRGISVATGTHLLFLDADDLLHEQALERRCAVISGTNNTVVLTNCGYFRESPLECFSTTSPKVDNFFPHIIMTNFSPPHSYLVPADIARRTGGFAEHLTYYEDWDFWCQVALTGAELVCVDTVSCFYRRTAGSQLGKSSALDRSRGHVAVMQRLICGMLDRRKDVISKHGDIAFWQGWTAFHQSRKLGATWGELRPLAEALQELLNICPRSLRNSRFGFAIRTLGISAADRIRSLFCA